jgi:hypothetical protein
MKDSRTKGIVYLLIGLLIFLIIPFVQPSVNLYGSMLIPLIVSQLGIFHQQETLANITYNMTYLKITSITKGTIVSSFAYNFLYLYNIFEYIIIALIYMYILGQYIVKYIILRKLRKHGNVKYKS